MGSRMVYDIRAIYLEDLIHTVGIAHRCNENHQIQFRIPSLQLLLNIISIILINIHNQKPLRMVSCNLPAKLTADRATASRHHNHFAADIADDLVNICMDRLSAQQILDLYFS